MGPGAPLALGLFGLRAPANFPFLNSMPFLGLGQVRSLSVAGRMWGQRDWPAMTWLGPSWLGWAVSGKQASDGGGSHSEASGQVLSSKGSIELSPSLPQDPSSRSTPNRNISARVSRPPKGLSTPLQDGRDRSGVGRIAVRGCSPNVVSARNMPELAVPGRWRTVLTGAKSNNEAGNVAASAHRPGRDATGKAQSPTRGVAHAAPAGHVSNMLPILWLASAVPGRRTGSVGVQFDGKDREEAGLATRAAWAGRGGTEKAHNGTRRFALAASAAPLSSVLPVLWLSATPERFHAAARRGSVSQRPRIPQFLSNVPHGLSVLGSQWLPTRIREGVETAGVPKRRGRPESTVGEAPPSLPERKPSLAAQQRPYARAPLEGLAVAVEAIERLVEREVSKALKQDEATRARATSRPAVTSNPTVTNIASDEAVRLLRRKIRESAQEDRFRLGWLR